MSSINDWAAKAARRISSEISPRAPFRPTEERIAAIIATFAEPLVALLRESRREHDHEEDTVGRKYCCPQCTCESWQAVAEAQEGGELDAERSPNSDEPCDCGAEAWNKRVVAALEGFAHDQRT